MARTELSKRYLNFGFRSLLMRTKDLLLPNENLDGNRLNFVVSNKTAIYARSVIHMDTEKNKHKRNGLRHV